MPTLPFLQNFSWAIIRMDTVIVLAKFEVRSFSRSWDNRGYPKKLGSPWIRPCSLFSKIFNGLLFRWTLWVYWPNLKAVAFPFPEIIGIPPINWAVPGYAHSSVLQNFSSAFIRMDPVIVLAKFEVRSFSRSWDNSDWSFGWDSNPQSWGRGGRRGSVMVPLSLIHIWRCRRRG